MSLQNIAHPQRANISCPLLPSIQSGLCTQKRRQWSPNHGNKGCLKQLRITQVVHQFTESATSLTGIWALRIDSFGQSLLFPSWPWPLSSLGTIGLSGRRTRSKLCPTAFCMSWGGKSVKGVHPLWKPSPTRHKTCCHIIQVYLNDVTAGYIRTHIWSPSGYHLINKWSPVGKTKAIH